MGRKAERASRKAHGGDGEREEKKVKGGDRRQLN